MLTNKKLGEREYEDLITLLKENNFIYEACEFKDEYFATPPGKFIIARFIKSLLKASTSQKKFYKRSKLVKREAFKKILITDWNLFSKFDYYDRYPRHIFSFFEYMLQAGFELYAWNGDTERFDPIISMEELDIALKNITPISRKKALTIAAQWGFPGDSVFLLDYFTVRTLLKEQWYLEERHYKMNQTLHIKDIMNVNDEFFLKLLETYQPNEIEYINISLEDNTQTQYDKRLMLCLQRFNTAKLIYLERYLEHNDGFNTCLKNLAEFRENYSEIQKQTIYCICLKNKDVNKCYDFNVQFQVSELDNRNYYSLPFYNRLEAILQTENRYIRAGEGVVFSEEYQEQKTIEELKKYSSSITSLYIHNTLSKLEYVPPLPNLTKLHILGYSNNDRHLISMDINLLIQLLNAAPNLKTLKLDAVIIHGVQKLTIEPKPFLNSFHAKLVQFSNSFFSQLLSQSLIKLMYLSGCFTDSTFEWPKCAVVSHLQLSNNEFKEERAFFPKGIALDFSNMLQFPNLKRLCLSLEESYKRNNIKAFPKSLEKLNLNFCKGINYDDLIRSACNLNYIYVQSSSLSIHPQLLKKMRFVYIEASRFSSGFNTSEYKSDFHPSSDALPFPRSIDKNEQVNCEYLFLTHLAQLNQPALYRLKVYNTLDISNYNTDIKLSHSARKTREYQCPVVSNLLDVFNKKAIPSEVKITHFNPDHLAYSEQDITTEWQQLYSISPDETLVAIEKTNPNVKIEMRYDETLNVYETRASEKTRISFLLHIDNYTMLTFDHIEEIKNEAIRKIFKKVNRFTAKELKGTPFTGHELITMIGEEEAGACDCRATYFKWAIDKINKNLPETEQIQCRLVRNPGLHRRVENKLPGEKKYVGYDLGGAPVTVNNSQFQSKIIKAETELKSKPDLKEDKQFAKKQAILKEIQELEIKKQFSYSDLDEACDHLLKWLEHVQPTGRQVLLIFKQHEQILLFNTALIRLSKKQGRNYVFCNKLAELSEMQIPDIKKGNLTYKDSSLKQFLDAEQKLVELEAKESTRGIWLVNSSEQGPLSVRYQSLYDPQRMLDKLPIPPGISILCAIDAKKAQTLREDRVTRFEDVIEVPVSLFPSGYHFEEKIQHSQRNYADKNYYNSKNFHRSEESWEDFFLGKQTVAKGIFDTAESEFEKMLRDHKENKETKGGCTLGALPKSAEFKRFWTELGETRYYQNIRGARVTIPDSFILDWYYLNFEPTTKHVSKIFNAKSDKWDYLLNNATFESFFSALGVDSNHNLDELKGWIESHPNDEMKVRVTSELSDEQFALIIEEAKKHNKKLTFLPNRYIKVPFVETSYEDYESYEPKQLDEAKITDTIFKKSISILISHDLDLTYEAIKRECKEIDFHTFSISADMNYELFEKWNLNISFANERKESKESKEVKNTQTETQHIFSLLKAGKTVILKGHIAPDLAQNLQTLFHPEPHLYINGKREKISGRLIILTSDRKIFVGEERFEHEFDPKQLLAKLTTDEKEIELISTLSNEFQIKLSYVQAKDLLKRMKKFPLQNPLESYLLLDSTKPVELLHRANSRYQLLRAKLFSAETKEIKESKEVKNELTQRLNDIDIILQDSPYVFLMGPSGTGKSSVILTDLPKYYAGKDKKTTVFVGWDQFDLWVNPPADKEQHFLFFDEASLAENGEFDLFEGLYDTPPRFFRNNQWYTLKDNQKIIFAGNYLNYKDRKAHEFFTRHGAIYHFPEFSLEHIKTTILMPLLQSLCSELQLNDIEKIATQFITKYKEARILNTKILLTTRNLETMALLFASRYVNGNDVLKTAELAAKEILHEFSGTEMKSNIDLSVEQKGFGDFILTDTHARIIEVLNQEMIIRKLRNESKLSINSIGTRGLLIEGASGIGKSALVRRYLENKREKYVHINTTNEDDLISILTQAFHEGAIVTYDELNAALIEKSLNIFMMGRDLLGKEANKPGFYVIATQNPIDFNDREDLSPALKNRFRIVKNNNDYPQKELIDILKNNKKVDDLSAECLVEHYLIKCKTNPIKPTMRILLKDTDKLLHKRAMKNQVSNNILSSSLSLLAPSGVTKTSDVSVENKVERFRC